MKVRYIGESFGVEGLTNNKIYNVVKIEGDMIRVIDDSGEDYLYSIINPSCLEDYKKCGKWEIVEDNENRDLQKVMDKNKCMIRKNCVAKTIKTSPTFTLDKADANVEETMEKFFEKYKEILDDCE